MMNVFSRSAIPLPLTIGQRLLAMVVLFIAALGTILAVTLATVHDVETDAVMVDIAGRQRMMIQRYFNETILVSHGIDKDLHATRHVLLNSVDALRNGGTVTVDLYSEERRSMPPAPTAQVRDLLTQQRALLTQFFSATRTLLLDAPGHAPTAESFSVLNRLQDDLLRNADEVVKLLSAHSPQAMQWLLRSEPIIGILVLIFSVILARQVAATSRRLEQEIEQRQQAEDERNRFFTLSPDLFCIAGLDGMIKTCNPAWEKELGYSTAELHTRSLTEFVHPDDRHAMARELAVLSQGTRSAQFENRFVAKDGSVTWWLWNAAVGRGEHVMYATARNVNERKVYEEELTLRDRSINSATNGILIADARRPDVPTVYCNAAFEKITGYAKEEVVGRNCRFLQGDDHDQPGLDAIRQAIRDGTEGKAELRNYRKDGRVFWNEFFIAPVKDSQGTLTHFIGVQTDVTRRKNQEAELARKTEALAHSNAELQQFAYVASHDLQEPLRMVASYTQLLRKRYQGKLDDDADEFIGYAVDGADRMQRLIRDLLEYSRVGSANKSFEITECERILHHVISNLSASIRDHHATVTHDPLPTIYANPTLLTQVFQNLIGNALKFQGSSPAGIHVGAHALSDGWKFFVRDNGIGIPPDQRDRIFAIFQRLHGRSDYPGTGIGLAICKRIVEQHNGTIWVDSEPGKGSTFFFTVHTPRVT